MLADVARLPGCSRLVAGAVGLLLLGGAGCAAEGGALDAAPTSLDARTTAIRDASGDLDAGVAVDGGPGVDTRDASLGAEDAAGPRLELGEGATAFRRLEDGDTLLLARGCQGSQHVWVSLRAHDLLARGMTVELELVRADGIRVSSDFLVRISFADDPAGFAALNGLTLQVPSPDPDIGVDLLLRGSVEDTSHRRATTERRVRIAWGTEVCSSP